MLLIQKYFPNLTEIQFKQFEALQGLYEEWNSQINVISRKDIEALYLRHVLHSLALAKLIEFNEFFYALIDSLNFDFRSEGQCLLVAIPGDF